MKIIPSLFAILIATPALAATPASYPLKCRGVHGEGMSFEFSATTLLVSFKKASRPATPGSLNPGECSWLDRVISPNEPSIVEMHPKSPKQFWGNTTIRLAFVATPGPYVFQAAPLTNPTEPELGALKSLTENDGYWTFKVYNDNDGHFIATDSAPATP